MKKNKKLAVQVALASAVTFLLTNIVIALIIITGTKRMYLESKNEEITGAVLDHSRLYMNVDILPFVLNAWESDPDVINRPYTEEEQKLREAMEFIDRLSYEIGINDLEADSGHSEGLLKALYDNAASSFDYQREYGVFKRLTCVHIHDDGSITVVMKSDETSSGNSHSIGEPWGKDINMYPGLKKISTGAWDSGYFDLIFEEVNNRENDEALYVAYAPVLLDGKDRYVIFTEYDWTSFAQILRSNLLGMLILGFAGMIISNAVLIIYIYKKAVRPAIKVNKGLREYMETKDSASVVQNMSGIGSRNEIGRIADSFADMSVEIDNYTKENLRLNSERERAAAELDLATKIQASQLPSEFPAFPERNEFDIYASMTPAKEVGGDFYDFFLIDDDHLGLVIADVSGKGVPAAMFMMISKMMIKNFALSGFSPKEVLEKTNENIFESNKEKMFVTVWFGILEISSGKITAANAGHEYPAVRQPDGRFELLKDKHGFMIGIRKNKKYTEYELELPKGATLFVYTDGVSEATDSSKTLFGTDRMLEALNKKPDASPERLLGNVHTAVNEFVGDAPQFDDLTMLAIKIN